MKIECSFFNGVADTKPRPFVGSWPELKAKFEVVYHPRRGTVGEDAKRSLPAICGASFQPGTTRRRDNVQAIGLVCLDFDNAIEVLDPMGQVHERTGHPVMVKAPAPDPASLCEIAHHLENRGVAAFLWSTWSSSPQWRRFRVVIPLTSPCPPEVWGPFTEWALDHLRLNPWRNCLDLPVLRDTARINFLPGAPDPSTITRWEVNGVPLEVPLEGLEHVEVDPAPMHPWQRERLAIRSAEGYQWAARFVDTDGRHLDLATLNGVRLLEALGCAVGPPQAYGNGVKHRTQCPWATEHSHGENDDAAVLFLENGRWPVWKCLHSHHAHLGLVDLMEAADVLRG